MCEVSDSKLRRTQVIANSCLVFGIALWMLVHPAGQIRKDVLHAVAGLLIGVSIAANLQVVRRRRRSRNGGSTAC